ncbi:avidin/streptavidin family protein [Catenulispora subtropica]|uniref:Avidin family protein n=1 Tax=Catenulispora subtropica TaxID=450798 RepID=A0ABN2T794_9ACTN
MSINGEWFNEFGSVMSITLPSGEPGALHGFYNSQVGEAIGAYPLVGYIGEPEEAGFGIPLGWAVSWRGERRNAFSVTCWSGQYLQDVEQILATWLLTRSMEVGNAWEATVIGHDVFRREKPTAEDVARSLRSNRPLSHPASRSVAGPELL